MEVLCQGAAPRNREKTAKEDAPVRVFGSAQGEQTFVRAVLDGPGFETAVGIGEEHVVDAVTVHIAHSGKFYMTIA